MLIITAQPNVVQYAWQTRVQIVNMQQYGYDKLLHVLVLAKEDQPIDSSWLKLSEEFPQVAFHWHVDTDNLYETHIEKLRYESLVRPYVLAKHYSLHPELSGESVFYIDSDVLFLKAIDFEKLLQDDIVYLSDTIDYIGAKYFDSKIGQVILNKMHDYRKIDVLNECARIFSLDRNIIQANQERSGGAQYLLKGIDADFWKDVLAGCVKLKRYLQSINTEFFVNENEGFQSYCSDMWAVLWSLWKRGIKTQIAPDLSFAWSTDFISVLGSKALYHDAGMTPFFKNGFQKTNYRLKEPATVTAQYFNPDFCTSWYVQQIEKAYKK
jgi:hypothetical protein